MKEYHSKFEFEKYYHIFNRGNNRENIFCNKGNYQYFLAKWEHYIVAFADILSYCLMPNHFHFLVKVKSQKELTSLLTNPENLSKPSSIGKVNVQKSTKPIGISRSNSTNDINKLLEDQFRNLFSGYTLAFNNQQNRSGSLFQKRFKRIEIANDDYLTTIIHYIHHNPIHHGFVDDYSKWKFSSYNAMLSKEETSLNRKIVLDWFGGQSGFEEFHSESKNLNAIKSLIMEEKSTNS